MKNKTLRSRLWFNNPDDREMTALYLERYLNYGLTREELQSNRPIIGIAQTGSDLSPCNRHHIELSKRVRDGINAAGGTVIEIPVHPYRKQEKDQQRCWIETLPISLWLKLFLDIQSMALS